MSNTNTPITEKLWQHLERLRWHRGLQPFSTVMESHEMLERELAEAQERIGQTREILCDAIPSANAPLPELARIAIVQRDQLAEACRMLMDIIGPKDLPAWADDDQIDAAYNAGEQALAALNQPGETKP